MTGLIRAAVILAGLSWLASAGARATPAVKIELCHSAKGLSAQVSSQALAVLLQVGRLYGVTLAPQGCCPDPACLRAAASEREVTGLVVVELLRFGPMVRISLRAIDTATGADVIQLKSSASARGFPDSAKQLKKDVRRCIEALGARRLAAATRPKPKPRPKPDPVPEPVVDLAPQSGSPPVSEAEPEPGPVISDAEAAAIVSKRTTLNWTGGGLMAGGGVLLAVGIGLLAGPLQTAMNERDKARAAWLATDDAVLRDQFYRVMIDRDDAAKTYNTVGWVGVGLGAGLAVAGLVTMLLAPELPEDAPLARVGIGLRPTLGSDGGGAALRLSW